MALLAKVITDYTPDKDDGIPLKAGKEVIIHEQPQGAFWRGESGGECGLFPGLTLFSKAVSYFVPKVGL